ncbi:MAG: homocysteine S-methyltransferase, partial [Longimicrobiales bacterium]|nr:homocysteine S-methyltransferase [Longimicrobiales bacterium]
FVFSHGDRRRRSAGRLETGVEDVPPALVPPMIHAGRPLEGLLSAQGYVVLDGGLSTELERRGHSLASRLWSARLLRADPDAILEAHRDFLEAGADCITTVSYQASYQGFAEEGIPAPEASELLRLSSELALQAREEHVEARAVEASEGARSGPGRPEPLVAASIGPYGAYLADGSEYAGRYGIPRRALRDFHAERLHLLADTGVDLLACETIPSAGEVEILLEVLGEDPGGVPAWLSFSCRDRARLADGAPLEDVVDMCAGHPRVAAVGVNCIPPSSCGELVARARSVTDLTLVVYPNSGERYDATTGTWAAPPAGRRRGHQDAWLEGVLDAREAGADVLGGCCRVGPGRIRMLRDALEGRD